MPILFLANYLVDGRHAAIMALTSYIIIFSTVPSEKEGVKIANTLVSKKLVACVNIIPKIRSIYRWKGKVCDEREVMLVMKSKKSLVGEIKKELKKLHSYECPELIILPIQDGLAEYLEWITESTK